MNFIFIILIVFILILISIEDISHKKIPNKYILILIILFPVWILITADTWNFLHEPIISVLVNAGIIVISQKLSDKKFGGGDIKLISVLSLYTGFPDGAEALGVSLILAFPFALAKRGSIAMGPYISLGFSLILMRKALQL